LRQFKKCRGNEKHRFGGSPLRKTKRKKGARGYLAAELATMRGAPLNREWPTGSDRFPAGERAATLAAAD
jgi:hypothetical protein